MKISSLRAGASRTVIAAALVTAAPALAQSTEAAPTKVNSQLAAGAATSDLDTIVVTASSRDKTALKSSLSVTSVSQQAIQDFTPRSEAEVFRLIPGIHAEDTAGPGGNSNISVRGIPVVTGGSEFVQLQEDGLPTVLFGDMNFGNNDYWTRYDTNVERVEAVRGGGASTFASQAPGAVINYISNTGDKDGGAIGFSKAVNYVENKIDVSYGQHITDTLRFHIGGFFKDGNGPTHIGYNAVQGYQVKGNITNEFADGKGYIRFNFKRLDDKEPTFTVSPSLIAINGNKVSNFQPLPGFDARNGSNQSIYNQNFKVLNYDGTVENVPMEGIHVKSTSLGGEFHYEFSNNFSVQDNFRWTDQSGAFRTQFVNVATTASVIGSTVNGQTVGSIVYANGPNQGKAFTGPYLNNNPNIDTNMTDMGSLVNDLALAGKFEVGAGNVSAKAGWFHMRQTIAQDWHVNPQYNDLTGSNPAQLDLFTGANGTGAQLTAAGQAGFNNNWGNCCARAYHLTYTDDAPYASLNYNGDGLDLDASVRYDSVKASGYALGGVAGPNVSVTDNLGTAILPSLVAGGPQENLNYTKSYVSYSAGALYAFGNDTSVFGRISRGGRFNADRRILGGNINADGSLNAQGETTAVNFVTQQEIGTKHRGRLSDGNYNVEFTVFRAQLTDNNYDFTLITQGKNPVISNVYHAYGAEFSGGLHFGRFNIVADATFTKSKILATNTAPHANPQFQFQVSPSYDAGIAAVGLSINGQSSTFNDDANTYRIPGQTYVNGFLKLRPYGGLELGINVNNLFNTLGYRGSGSILNTGATTGIFQNSAVLGRTITGSIFYRF